MGLRWKMLLSLGTALLALALLVDWPQETDPSLPEARLFLLLLGGIIIIAGIVIRARQEN